MVCTIKWPNKSYWYTLIWVQYHQVKEDWGLGHLRLKRQKKCLHISRYYLNNKGRWWYVFLGWDTLETPCAVSTTWNLFSKQLLKIDPGLIQSKTELVEKLWFTLLVLISLIMLHLHVYLRNLQDNIVWTRAVGKTGMVQWVDMLLLVLALLEVFFFAYSLILSTYLLNLLCAFLHIRLSR